jgi:phage/plasmid-associated DNA primase
LQWACVNLAAELEGVEVEESAQFKKLITGEGIIVRPIYAKPFNMKPHCKVMALANNIPRFRFGTDAELRRIRMLGFNQKPKPEEVDNRLGENLCKEASGIWNVMLEHLQKLLTAREFPYGSPQNTALYTRFNIGNDPIGSFLATHCVIEVGATCPKIDLTSNFERYCQVHGLPVKIGARFFRTLYERHPTVSVKRLGSDGARVQAITGIRMLPDSPVELYGPVEQPGATIDIDVTPPPPPQS